MNNNKITNKRNREMIKMFNNIKKIKKNLMGYYNCKIMNKIIIKIIKIIIDQALLIKI